MNQATLILGARDVSRFLPMRECIDAIASACRAHESGKSAGPASAGFALPGGSVHAKVAAAECGGRNVVAVKANVNLPGNPERHRRPTIQGALILFDATDGQPLAMMDSITVTSIRTAAVAALAADHLALDDAHTVTIIGCGEQGAAQLRAMAVVRPVRTCVAIDLDADKAVVFARRLSAELACEVTASADIAAAIGASEICVTCTTSASPFIVAKHLHPGLFVAAVGADNPAKQEIEAAALASSRVVVDSVAACAAGGDLHHAIKAGVMATGDVFAELSAIVAGKSRGRTSRDEVFVFDSVGTALQDVAAAALVYRRAVEAGAGRPVVLDDRD